MYQHTQVEQLQSTIHQMGTLVPAMLCLTVISARPARTARLGCLLQKCAKTVFSTVTQTETILLDKSKLVEQNRAIEKDLGLLRKEMAALRQVRPTSSNSPSADS